MSTMTINILNSLMFLGLLCLGILGFMDGSNNIRCRLGSTALLVAIAIIFGLELFRGAVGNESALLKLGALPDNGQIHGEYWRFVTFGFLHLTPTHVLLNTSMLFWIGPVVERRVGTRWFFTVFMSASIASGSWIFAKHLIFPTQGASIGASGGMFGLLGAALILVFRIPTERISLRVAVIVVLVLGLANSFLPTVSLVGHISGFVVGAILALFISLVVPLRLAASA